MNQFRKNVLDIYSSPKAYSHNIEYIDMNGHRRSIDSANTPNTWAAAIVIQELKNKTKLRRIIQTLGQLLPKNDPYHKFKFSPNFLNIFSVDAKHAVTANHVYVKFRMFSSHKKSANILAMLLSVWCPSAEIDINIGSSFTYVTLKVSALDININNAALSTAVQTEPEKPVTTLQQAIKDKELALKDQNDKIVHTRKVLEDMTSNKLTLINELVTLKAAVKIISKQ